METLLLRSRLDGVDEDFIPQEPEEITREWLFAVINQYRKVRDLSLLAHPDDITDCSIDECDSSHGYLSTTYKLLANFHCKNPLGSEECSYAFFLKMLPGVEDKHRKLLWNTEVFRKEIQAQFHLLPLLQQFLSQQCDPPLELRLIPDVVYGSFDEKHGDGIVVLMDLNERGFFPLDHYFGLSLAQLERVVERLAEFHGSGSAALLKTAKSGDKQKHTLSGQFQQFHMDNQKRRQSYFESLYPQYRDFAKFLRRVPGYSHFFDIVDQLRPHLIDIMNKADKRKSRFPFKTILHGELWDKNILFRYEQLTQNLEFVLTDWKHLSMGSPCQDLAFLILSSTNKSLRHKHLKHILTKYFHIYCNHLKRVHSLQFPKPGFTLEQFVQEYQDASLGAFLQVVTVMIREVKYLEAEFLNAVADGSDEALSINLGEQLRILGRRLLELADEFIPQLSQLPAQSGTSGSGKVSPKTCTSYRNHRLIKPGCQILESATIENRRYLITSDDEQKKQ